MVILAKAMQDVQVHSYAKRYKTKCLKKPVLFHWMNTISYNTTFK